MEKVVGERGEKGWDLIGYQYFYKVYDAIVVMEYNGATKYGVRGAFMRGPFVKESFAGEFYCKSLVGGDANIVAGKIESGNGEICVLGRGDSKEMSLEGVCDEGFLWKCNLVKGSNGTWLGSFEAETSGADRGGIMVCDISRVSK
jgi:hypothetical protein